MKGFDLPKELLLGCATAATQIEGGDVNVNWYDWSLKGRVGKGESSIVGAGHWDRVVEDVALLSELNQQVYRMSLEWSRIEPREGEWSAEGIEHYREELKLLRSKGITPLVTLHHFSCPQWFQERGAWLAPDAVETFVRFAEKAVGEFGDLVAEWCTINEPNVFANDSYLDGKYPPGADGDLGAYIKVSAALIRAHLKAYKSIHRIRTTMGWHDTQVGFAHHLAVFEPANIFAVPGMAINHHMFHEIYFKGFVEGKLVFPLGSGFPEGRGRFCDFIGINYYSRHLFQPVWRPATLFVSPGVDPATPAEQLNDLGWEIYPEGLSHWARKVWKRYKLPLVITENGIPDAADAKRWVFIKEHLAQVKTLIDEGVRITRYCYWSFLDNLEWNDGYGPRFGLVEVDYKTMRRTVRPSALKYAHVCGSHRVPEEELP